MEKETILQAMKEIFDIAQEEESEWGMPMKRALYKLAEKLDIALEYCQVVYPEYY